MRKEKLIRLPSGVTDIVRIPTEEQRKRLPFQLLAQIDEQVRKIQMSDGKGGWSYSNKCYSRSYIKENLLERLRRNILNGLNAVGIRA